MRVVRVHFHAGHAYFSYDAHLELSKAMPQILLGFEVFPTIGRIPFDEI